MESEDIIAAGAEDWLVVGWFTPDYSALAKSFASNLDEVGAPYHLFRRVKPNGKWDARQKPSVVLQAMAAYPGKTLILMDVDCRVVGDLAPAAMIPGDVGISIKVWQADRDRRQQKRRFQVTAGSRVMVFKPSPAALGFVLEWERHIKEEPTGGDETALGWAYLLNPGISYTHLNPRYTGHEIGAPTADSSTIVWHDSEHERARGPTIRAALRSIERRWFRTGATKAQMRERL